MAKIEGADSVELRSLIADHETRLQTLQADFANYRRRVERDREGHTRLANEDLIGKLLPVLDDFERAMRSAPEESEWVKGMAMVERALKTTLGEAGLARIEAEGREFDPEEHEAVSFEEGGEAEDGMVESVIRQGYRLHGKLLRPAQVSVGRRYPSLPRPLAGTRIPVRIRRE